MSREKVGQRENQLEVASKLYSLWSSTCVGQILGVQKTPSLRSVFQWSLINKHYSWCRTYVDGLGYAPVFPFVPCQDPGHPFYSTTDLAGGEKKRECLSFYNISHFSKQGAAMDPAVEGEAVCSQVRFKAGERKKEPMNAAFEAVALGTVLTDTRRTHYEATTSVVLFPT